ncbi:MAG TPA: site-2 protease family protein [Rectinemataceae bacterium]
MSIILGLLGLSLVVVVHEFGHFLAARAVGVDVEAFSIGWGPRLAGFVSRGTEWRLSAFPLGGYCRMKGEHSFKRALDEGLTHIPSEPGSFYGASPARRMAILVAGPAANVLLAIFLFSFVSLIGIPLQTAPNRIVLASEVASAPSQPNPADLSGLKTGDWILEADGRPVRDYADLQEAVGTRPNQPIRLLVKREEATFTIDITPRLDTASGQGFIGVYAWIDPIIEKVESGQAGALAGFKAGDRILAVNGKTVEKTTDLISALGTKPERADFIILREGKEQELKPVLSYGETGQSDLGIEFKRVERRDRTSSLGAALLSGFSETWKTFRLSIQGVGLLFKGVDIFKALSGPARITYLVGSTAQDSIRASGFSGLGTILSFLAFLSVGLGFMNLLPVPALDGGQILLSVAEAAKRSPLKARTIYRYQFVGAAMIAAIFLVATLGDLFFFAGK